MTSIREQIVDLIFSLSDEQLEQLRKLINTNTELEAYSKEEMNKNINNTHKNMQEGSLLYET